MWYYQSAAGLLRIVRDSHGICQFRFGEDDTEWTGHVDPRSVADDVFNHATGCLEWDSSKVDTPQDLSEWIYEPD